MKPKLLLHPDKWSNATAFFLEELYQKHFDISYDLNDDGIVYAHWQDWEWAKSLNRPAIIDHLWDSWANPEIVDTDLLKVIRSDGWFCIANECLWYKALGYDEYQSTNTNDQTFLMLMNYQRAHRDQIWEKIQPYLDNALYSYQDRRVSIEGDIAREEGLWQRHLNQSWYNKTKYSLVVETDVTECHSEKILKPCAYRHPFITWAPQGYLFWLRSWGFETFDNCIDESYDLETDNTKRLEMIIKEVARLNAKPKDYFLDNETQRRLDNNYKRFYNIEWAYEQMELYFDQIKEYSSRW